jgi:hypothetical protein
MEEIKELAKRETGLEVSAVDINSGNLPDLENARELPFDLIGNYWTPEKEGESKRLFFVEIKTQQVLSANGTGELIDLDCVSFLEQTETGLQTVCNGSRRLVGVLEQYVSTGAIKQGTPLKITYLGKRKNKTNNFSSDSWSVKPLLINI